MLKNILKDIELNCKDCKSISDAISFLVKRGDFSYTSDYYREVWFFYLESLSLFEGKHHEKKKKARELTQEMFKISRRLFYYIRKSFKD